jgi:2-keto-4-pentenoate hydratase
MGDRESIGGWIAVGYVTSETVLASRATYRADPRGDLHADAEATVEFARDVDAAGGTEAVRNAIGRYGAALEIVDLARVPGEPAAVVATNVFHRAVAFAELEAPPSGHVRILVNGEVRGAGVWPHEVVERLAAAARVLGAVGERLRARDRVITGSIVQVPIRVSDVVVADFGGLAEVRLRIDAT